MRQGEQPKPKTAGRGRPVGVGNKVAVQQRDHVLSAFEAIGGAAKLAEWAKANQTDFYKAIWTRIVPQESAESAARAVTAVLDDKGLAQIAAVVAQVLDAKRAR